MLTWSKICRRSYGGTVIRESLKTVLPGWGEASIHSHIHYPGELFLTCDSLGIEMYPLGQISLEDAPKPAEAELERVVRQYAAWCEEALTALHDEPHE